MKKNALTYKRFLVECNNALGFLTRDYGFSQPTIEIDPKANFLYITFFKSEIAIECIYDEREDVVELKIVKLINGEKPDIYRVNDKGDVYREHLTEILMHRGIRDLKFESPTNDRHLPRQQAYFRKALFGYARLLTKYCPDILNGSSQLFADLK